MAANPKRRLMVGGTWYTVDDAAGQDVPELIGQALNGGAVVGIQVLDDNDRRMVLHLNGALVDVVVWDEGAGPRPMEVS